MWCKTCRQDVPGIASFEEGAFSCARCGQRIPSDPALASTTHTANLLEHGIDLSAAAKPAAPLAPPAAVDDWELDEQLRHAERMLRSTRRSEPAPAAERPRYRFDAALPREEVSRLPAPHFLHRRQPAGNSLLAMLLLLVGLMGVVCGSVLLGWGWRESRPELWNLGLPITLGSQGVMLLGLLLQLERLWRNGRETASQLEKVDEQLHDLQQSTFALQTTHAGPAKSFYRHYSEGASPRLLMADLKGQLDLLAHRLER